jgi:glycosyltransferase involved in cell wall biosynthesis
MAEDDSSLQGATVQLVGSVDTADKTWLEDMRRDFDSITMETPGRVKHEEALRYIRDADVCVCPLSSTVENYVHAYPIKVFEYMAGGCAIIATELKGTSRIINDGETGLLIPPETSRAWADALKTLYRDDDFRRRLGESALKSVEEYEWARIIKQIGERIEEEII